MISVFEDLVPESATSLSVILNGLSKDQKTIPPKYFYDAQGAAIFEQICLLPEYYPTRAEKEILFYYAEEMARIIGENALIIEPGSGSSEKVRYLLKALKQPAGYVPIEISRDILLRVMQEFSHEFPLLPVHAICSDFLEGLILPKTFENTSKRVIFFPGSTIGNFTPVEAINFLIQCEEFLNDGDGILVGVDLKKDKETLERAYDDAQGVTAAFNLNLLVRLNREFDANFDLNEFEHKAYYNQQLGRVEMHLISLKDQTVCFGNAHIHFKRGESIHTENSYKYSVDEFAELCSKANFKLLKVWKDSNHKFCVYYLQKDY